MCGVCGNVGFVAAVVKDSVLNLGVLKYIVCLSKGCDGCCVFCLYCDACMCLCMGSMSVSHAYVVCVRLVGILWQFSILHDLQYVDAGRGCKRLPYGRGILQSRSHDCLIGSQECLLLFTPSCYWECFYHL